MKAIADIPEFREHLQSTLQTLRATIIELLANVGADPSRPQDLSRRFGLNKNLTWKISKIAGSLEPYAAVPHIPGAAGLEIFFRALERADASKPLLDRAHAAAREFDRVVKVHTGDRTTLEIMVSGMLPAAVQVEQAEQARKLAFQGNSSVWGVRAKTQVTLQVIAPNADDPEMADLAQIGGLAGFRRLRPEARWLLFRRERWSDDDPNPPPDVVESLDPEFPCAGGVPLLGAFCSKPIPEIRAISDEGEEQYELPSGPVGNTAAFTCIYGQVARRVGAVHAAQPGEYSEVGVNLVTPVENLLFDVLVHRDFEWAMSPEIMMYSRMDGGGMRTGARRDRNVLPVVEPVHDLGWGHVALASSLVPRYSKLASYVFERTGWNPDEFRAFRFTMSYPPIPTVALLRSELPVRGA